MVEKNKNNNLEESGPGEAIMGYWLAAAVMLASFGLVAFGLAIYLHLLFS